MKYERYGAIFPGYGLYWQDTGAGLDGVEDDDIVTAGQVRQHLAIREGQIGQALGIRELAKAEDFELVIKNHWPKMRDADPELAQAMQGMTPYQQAVFAYKMGKTDPDYKVTKTSPAQENEPKTRPDPRPRGPSASAEVEMPPAEDADYWRDLSEEEFDRARDKARGRTQAVDVSSWRSF